MSAAEEKLDRLLLDVAAIKALLTAMTAKAIVAPSGAVADDADLDSQWGDPVIKKDPPRWKGNSYAGSKMSECPADYLEAVARLFDWMASKDDEQGKTWTNKKGEEVPASSFKKKDAARARGWAQRIKAGYVQTQREPATEEQPDIPF